MTIMWRVQFIIVSAYIIVGVSTLKWVSLYRTVDMDWWTLEENCGKSRRQHELNPVQVSICRNNLHIMKHISIAANTAVTTCQQLFSQSRWNCSTITTAPNHTPDLTTGTREQAVVHALASAAVIWQLAKACSQGALLQCSCGALPRHPPDGEFKWGGCGDNVKFALKNGREFVFTKRIKDKKKRKKKKQIRDVTVTNNPEMLAYRHRVQSNRIPPLESYSIASLSSSHSQYTEKKSKIRRKHRKKIVKKKNNKNTALHRVNKHNTRVGIRVVHAAEFIKCKCHGVSGSCNVKTCWKSLPNFNQIGSRLHRRYSSGVEVKGVRIGARLRLLPSSSVVTRFTKDDLIYITRSPDYCLPDERHGSLGTHGRKCNASSTAEGGCDLMCCGRGAIPSRVFVSTRCQCRYHWCCYVTCATCSSWKTYHYCN